MLAALVLLGSVRQVAHIGFGQFLLRASACVAETGATLVPDDAAGKARQDRGQSDAAFEVRDVPTGRGGGHAELVRGDSDNDRAARAAAASRRRSDACRERRGVRKTLWTQGAVRALPVRSPGKHLLGHGSGRGNSEAGAVGEKMEKNPLRASRRGGRVVAIIAMASLARLQA